MWRMNTKRRLLQPILMHSFIQFMRVWKAAPVLFLVLAASASGLAQTGVKGKVRSNRGDGIPNATVTARQNGKDIRTVTSDRKGDFVLTGLDEGSYNIVFDASGFGTGVLYNVEVKKGIVRDLGPRLFLAVDRGSQIFVRGSVFYREGTSITGAKVELHEVYGDGTTRRIATVYTNVSGDFSFQRPHKSAKYRIIATFKEVTGSKDVEVDNAGIYRTAITLDIPRTEK